MVAGDLQHGSGTGGDIYRVSDGGLRVEYANAVWSGTGGPSIDGVHVELAGPAADLGIDAGGVGLVTGGFDDGSGAGVAAGIEWRTGDKVFLDDGTWSGACNGGRDGGILLVLRVSGDIPG